MGQTTRRIGVIGFEGVNSIDVTGPLEVFASAGRADYSRKESKGCYEVQVLGLTHEPFTAESGVRFVPHCRLANAPAMDTVIVPGGWGLREPAVNAAVSSWLRAHAARTRRVACVCTGIYGLAPTGVLDGRRVTTHWRFAEDVARRFPKLTVQADALFLKDGRYYTSGGITAGIDLALALIEEDLGPRISLEVARELVVYLKRSGGQDQYSEPLRFQSRSANCFADLVAWISSHLDRDLSVAALAARAHLSPRHFRRRFAAELGCTPADYVEAERLREARERLIGTAHNIERIARSVGFKSADVFRRSFERRFGIAPKSYRERFSSSD